MTWQEEREWLEWAGKPDSVQPMFDEDDKAWAKFLGMSLPEFLNRPAREWQDE